MCPLCRATDILKTHNLANINNNNNNMIDEHKDENEIHINMNSDNHDT